MPQRVREAVADVLQDIINILIRAYYVQASLWAGIPESKINFHSPIHKLGSYKEGFE